MRNLKLILSISVFVVISLAFNLKAQPQSQCITNVADLNLLSLKYEKQFRDEYKKAVQAAAENNWLVRKEYPDGSVVELRALDRNGMPLYFTTLNLVAAKTVSTYQVWPGGSTGLDLTGLGEIIGMWDAGKVRPTHQELAGRVTQMDGASSLSSHSTHVAGTLIATGIDPNAKGMAFKATLHAYDWTNDNAEMANAAANGLLLSNHSYGLITGWHFTGSYWFWFGDISVSQTEDYKFGFYSAYSQAFDQIAYNAPYYLIVRAAGNEKGEGPKAGQGHYYWTGSRWSWSTATRDKDGGSNGYDSMDPEAIPKNILTVGAVYDIPAGYTDSSDVVLYSASSRGPADDGRIKPDVVGNGIGVYSCGSGSDSDYYSGSGTSFAAPNVTGSLALLQELYKSLNNGTPMRAATLKGLAIHTADEAGSSDGPDYKFGWGLLNTAKAAQLIADMEDGWDDNLIRELSINDGDVFELQIHSLGTEPLKVTISWTDPPGTPMSPILNSRNRMLVNDLDLRVYNQTDTFEPWVLDPDNPEQPAIRGDNNADNVEQVYIENPLAGNYIINVTPKNSLFGGFQDYSLILSGASLLRSVTLLAPNGGEQWVAGTTHSISWQSLNFSDSVKIELSTDGGSHWSEVMAKVQNTGTFDWLVPDSVSDGCRIRISDTGNENIADSSDADFSITGLPAVQNLSIENNVSSLFLSWNSVVEADSYRVYRSTEPMFTPGGQNILTTTVDTFFEDIDDDIANNIIGDVDNNYFYLVRAINSVTESENSVRVGEYDFNLSANNSNRYNAISFCLWNNEIQRASELLAEIPNSISVAYWDGQSQQHIEYDGSAGTTDFVIREGYPYFVSVRSNVVFTVIGRYAVPQFSLITTSGTDFNAIVLPLTKSEISTADDLLADIPHSNSLAFWNETNQRFEQYSPIFPYTDFMVKPGQAYYVNMTANSNWP